MQAGSGFLAQHSKELFLGVGLAQAPIAATIRWPSGLSQQFDSLPVNHRIDIEEGSATFGAKPFGPPAYLHGGPPAGIEGLPEQVETWLIEPLKAPEFSAPDLSGATISLESQRARYALLVFWSADSQLSLDQLRLFDRNRQLLAASELQTLAVNVDRAADLQTARSIAEKAAFHFPVLFATDELAGIYNIVYRHLFDRRRDLGIPTAFLFDRLE